MNDRYRDEDLDHECPLPLDRPVSEFDIGGMFFSPACRWEAITDRSPRVSHDARVVLHIDATGTEYGWMFWRSTKLPYLSPCRIGQSRVVVFEHLTGITVEVTTAGHYGYGHTILSARPVRGAGWEINDQAGGTTVEQIIAPSKSRARSEVNRRARIHAKRLGLPLWGPANRH